MRSTLYLTILIVSSHLRLGFPSGLTLQFLIPTFSMSIVKIDNTDSTRNAEILQRHGFSLKKATNKCFLIQQNEYIFVALNSEMNILSYITIIQLQFLCCH